VVGGAHLLSTSGTSVPLVTHFGTACLEWAVSTVTLKPASYSSHPTDGQILDAYSRAVTGAVEEIAAKLVEWLELPARERQRAEAALAATAGERFGWEHVAEGVIAAAEGRLDELPPPVAG